MQYVPQIIKVLESLPVVGFLIAYYNYDFYIATATIMCLVTLFVLASYLAKQPLNALQLGTWVLTVGLGTLTLVARDDSFLKYKTTLINIPVSFALLLSHFFGKKTILEHMLPKAFKSSRQKLRKVNAAVAGYFMTIAGLNYYLAVYYSTTVWVNFKFIGVFILHFCFLFGCMYYLKDEMKVWIEEMEKK